MPAQQISRPRSDPRDEPNLTKDTYQAFCHIAAGPISTPDLATAMGRTNRQIGKRVAQLKALNLVQTDHETHFLTNHGRAQILALH